MKDIKKILNEKLKKLTKQIEHDEKYKLYPVIYNRLQANKRDKKVIERELSNY
jgi:hypothetical protein